MAILFSVSDFQIFYLCTDVLQSILDLGVSMMLLLKALLLKDTRVLHSEGVRGDLECRLWNAQNLLWGLFLSSTWNLVSLSFER